MELVFEKCVQWLSVRQSGCKLAESKLALIFPSCDAAHNSDFAFFVEFEFWTAIPLIFGLLCAICSTTLTACHYPQFFIYFSLQVKTILSMDYWKTIASANAACRWWQGTAVDSNDNTRCVKGVIKLLTVAKGGGNYVIAYSGSWSDDSCWQAGEAASWMFPLPSPNVWKVTHTKFKSSNSKARAMVIEFPAQQQLTKLQITIPFDGNGKDEKKFIDAFLLVLKSAATWSVVSLDVDVGNDW